jgi:putative DNA methylase
MPQYEQLSMFPVALAMTDEIIGDVVETEVSGKTLIEVALPSRTISIQGTAERYSHGKTPHSMHVWWARRPLSAMRAMIFASLAKIQDERDVQRFSELCSALAQFDPLPAGAIQEARSILRKRLSVLDLFGGGGSISFEAARLGCTAISVELNPLAVFVQRTLLNYSQCVDNLADMVRRYGIKLLQRLHSDTGGCFPFRGDRGETVAYFWVRAVSCSNSECTSLLPVKRVIPLTLRKNSSTYAVLEPEQPTRSFRARIVISDTSSLDTDGKWPLECPFCGNAIQQYDVRRNGTSFTILPVARCVKISNGKTYTPYQGDELPFHTLIQDELSSLGEELPATELPRWSGITNPTVYGITKHSDLFTPRQLLVLLKLIRGLRALYTEISRDRGREVARAIVACLSGLIDQLVDWNSSFSIWLPTNEQVGRSLAGPGLPMQWTFVEVDPVGRGPANLWDKLERIVQACETIPRFTSEPRVMSGSSTHLDLPDSSVDAIITDPPYADNLYYSILSDCIYAWKRLCLHDIFPEDFSLTRAPTEQELVASTRRKGNSHDALAFYRDNLKAALSEGHRVLRPEGVLSLIFTHSTLDGWIAAFAAVLGAGFRIVTCWPFCIERKARPRGLAQGAIHASCVIVAVKATQHISCEKLDEVEDKLSVLRSFLEKDGWSPAEIGLAVFVQRAAWSLRVKERGVPSLEYIRATVEECYRQTRDVIPEFSLKLRKMI